MKCKKFQLRNLLAFFVIIKLIIRREVKVMLYPYAEFPGELSITYSQVMTDDSVKGGKKILVHFEQPTDYGFKEARYELPDYKEIYNYDFTPSETKKNLDILKRNESLIWKCAEEEKTSA